MVQEIITSLVAGMTGEQVVGIEELPAGANSMVFLATTRGNARYLVKKYRPCPPGDPRDRLRTEYETLRFLWDRGIRQIPRPYLRVPEHRIGVYQYIQGRRLETREISARCLDSVAAFLHELHRLGQSPGAVDQPLASEACLCLEKHVEIVETRLDRLLAIPKKDELTARLHAHLENMVAPLFRRAQDLLAVKAGGMGLDPSAELPVEQRVLSPSDLGFQNILRTGEDTLVFIDFEYFGWDDPAKLIADFYLQPAVPLPAELRGYFLEKLDWLRANDAGLLKRLPFVYLFSALKWSLLVLNCFFSIDPAGSKPGDIWLRWEKLALSRRILQNMEEEMAGRAFPVDTL